MRLSLAGPRRLGGFRHHWGQGAELVHVISLARSRLERIRDSTYVGTEFARSHGPPGIPGHGSQTSVGFTTDHDQVPELTGEDIEVMRACDVSESLRKVQACRKQ